ERMEPCIRHNRGFIDKYIGDAIMALFPENSDAAVCAAIEMQQSLEKYNSRRIQNGDVPIKIGIGIHTGKMILGVVGGQKRIDTTVISDVVNTASRIEQLTKIFDSRILISLETVIALKDPEKYSCRYLGKIPVKGKADGILICEVCDADPEIEKQLKMKTRDDFKRGVESFYLGDYESAYAVFKKIYASNGGDTAARYYIGECENHLFKRELSSQIENSL
ncbi:MAG: adenylate/guanylate cyclase domain-containing protein, partial [Spirochaetota bacterium]